MSNNNEETISLNNIAVMYFWKINYIFYFFRSNLEDLYKLLNFILICSPFYDSNTKLEISFFILHNLIMNQVVIHL